MDFVQTGIGNKICSLAVRVLGNALKKRTQYAIWTNFGNVADVCSEEFEKGSTFVNHIQSNGNGGVVLIFERTV